MNHESRVGEAGQTAQAAEYERVAESVDANGENSEVDLLIGSEIRGLEDEFERREDEGERVWGRNQGSDQNADKNEKRDE
jgi:hypothetical protein